MIVSVNEMNTMLDVLEEVQFSVLRAITNKEYKEQIGSVSDLMLEYDRIVSALMHRGFELSPCGDDVVAHKTLDRLYDLIEDATARVFKSSLEDFVYEE